MIKQPSDFWSIPQADVLVGLDTRQEGLERAEARKRLVNYGANLLKPPKRSDTVTLLLAQFKSPIILTLIFAAGLSFFLQDHVDAAIILFIVLVSGLLGFWQERGAADAVEKLLSIVKIKTTVLRDGNLKDIPLEYVVPGDVVILNAGEAIPADCLILEAKDLFGDEATLTGETPRRWNISFIRKFMFTFGLISSIFDYLTFAVLLFILHATPEQFRTGWFMESVISAAIIVLVIRGRRPFFRSRPGKYLSVATIAVVIATLILPFTFIGTLFGFESLPLSFLMMMALIVALYILMAELAKRIFYQRVNL